jgi:hypothetical protein
MRICCPEHGLGIRPCPAMHSATNAIDAQQVPTNVRNNEGTSSAEFEFSALGAPSVLAKSAEVNRTRIPGKQ